MEKIKLFCLPYAGASATVYINWKRSLDKRIELKPLELAGRGKRFNEPFYNSMDEAIEDIYKVLSVELDGTPYAVFGHSMGTIFAYELIRKIICYGNREPVHVFMSGRYPPYIETEKENIHLLSDKEFINKIMKLGGTKEEVISNKELLDLFLPVLRADYRLIESYTHNGNVLNLNCDITVLNGKYDDYIIGKDVQGWRECTNKNCNFHEFDDGHFFINKYQEDVIGIVNRVLFMNQNT
ncbi:MAG TPA: thioesterase [Gallicola sp.]|nr:thioesterase [Gallicola sp.]